MKSKYFYNFLILTLISNIKCKNSYQNAQELHQKISNDLITLKKKYSGIQTKIYPILDQISQLYKISRNSINKKKAYKQKLISFNNQTAKLAQENKNLKQKLSNEKKINEENTKELYEINKKLKTRESQLLFLAKERESLNKKISQFEEEQLQQFSSNGQQNIANEKIINGIEEKKETL